MRTADWTDSVSVLDRVTAVLETFDSEGPLGVSEIARRANLPKSTVSRIVADLVKQRYLERQGPRLHLGLRLFELGQSVESPRRLRDLASPVMARLHALTGESVVVALRDGADIVVVAAVAGRAPGARATPIGARAPMGVTALGAAILAFSSTAESADPASARVRELAEIRRAGFAALPDESRGRISVASPILSAGRTPTAAIAVEGAADEFDPQRIGEAVCAAAATLSRRIFP